MVANFLVISPKKCAKSAKFLTDSLGASYKQSQSDQDYCNFDVVFNYGSSLEFKFKQRINHPFAVKKAINKQYTFTCLKDSCNVVPSTSKKEEALSWLQEDSVVVIRNSFNGSQGEGLIYAEDKTTIINSSAELFTKYVDSISEVRINVYKGKVLTIFEKLRKNGEFIFNNLKIKGEHPDVTKMIEAVSKYIGLDFYGLDVLITEDGKCVLLEVNSGPILHEETCKALIKLLKKEF